MDFIFYNNSFCSLMSFNFRIVDLKICILLFMDFIFVSNVVIVIKLKFTEMKIARVKITTKNINHENLPINGCLFSYTVTWLENDNLCLKVFIN